MNEAAQNISNNYSVLHQYKTSFKVTILKELHNPGKAPLMLVGCISTKIQEQLFSYSKGKRGLRNEI